MKIIFLGSQGSGKSTQAGLLAKKLNLPWIEMGNLFREKAKTNDDQSRIIKKALDSGHLVPDEIAVKTMHQRIAEPDCRLGYILDGYPRNQAQLTGLDQDIDKVFYIKISDQEAIARLLKRARADDTEEALKKRLAIYHRETEPLLDHFKKRRILEEIDGEKPIEAVEKVITSGLDDVEL